MTFRNVPRTSANKPIKFDPDDLTATQVLIMGLGRFGGGVAAARYFARRGAIVTVTDLRDEDELADSMRELQNFDITYALGGHSESLFQNTQIVIVNPAVQPDSPWLALAKKSGALCTTEMNLFIQLCKLPIIGVTGSNGKSTTAALTAAILQAAGIPVWLGGNIGRPLLDCEDIREATDGVVVLEQSSFQLRAAESIGYAPAVAIVTNLSPNHLDWHVDMQDYERSKQVITKFQNASDVLILNAEDETAQTWPQHSSAMLHMTSLQQEVPFGAWQDGNTLRVRTETVDAQICHRDQLALPGDCNVMNFLQASLAAILMGATPEHSAQVASAFQGLEHRLERFHTHSGIDFYNDSIATTPQSTIHAIHAVPRPIVLVLGGYDKGISFQDLATCIATSDTVKHIITLGASAERIEDALQVAGSQVPLQRVETFVSAVQRACEFASDGDAVLLSPACASYDMFSNFQERAEVFKAVVRECYS